MVLFPLAVWLVPCLAPPMPKAPVDPARHKKQTQLAAQLKELFLGVLPDPLYEDSSHWGRQERNLRGQLKNDGRWWKLRLEGRQLPNGLSVRIEDLQPGGKNRQTFSLYIDLMTNVLLERQTWLKGVRLYSGSTRARVKIQLSLACEIVSRLETPKGAMLPELVFRFRILNSFLSYDDLVVEHTAGVGGDTAKYLGELVLSIIKHIKPSLEVKLFERANAAILKAGDSKEIRIGLNGVSRGK
ncbi:MAG: hypothetical protein SNJ82_07375 [Gemmataceae bacterium]